MTLDEYLQFWKISWSYMNGSRIEFWTNIIPVTYLYRKIIIKEKKMLKGL